MKKLTYIKPKTEVFRIKAQPLLAAISVGVNTTQELDPNQFEAKSNKPDVWGYQDYDNESQWGNLWEEDQ